MNKEQLNNEIWTAENAYRAEINKNGGMEGTTLSVILKARLQMLKDIEEKYYTE